MSEQPLTYDWVAGKPKAVPADKLPPKEYMKGNLHIVDLSKCVDPYTESRRCNLWRFNTGGDVPDFHTNVDIGSHLGTHCECPTITTPTGPALLSCPWISSWAAASTACWICPRIIRSPLLTWKPLSATASSPAIPSSWIAPTRFLPSPA